MIQYKNLLAFDLTSYGTALSIVNQYVDDEVIKLFEVSPCGESAVLLLLSADLNALTIIKAECESFYKSSLLSVDIIEDIHPNLLGAYLSQNKAVLKKSLIILEGSLLSKALKLSNGLLKKNISLTDFRVVRTFPKNIILTFTSDDEKALVEINSEDFKKNYIQSIHRGLKSLYEIN